MRSSLEARGAGYQWYRARNDSYITTSHIPFRVSPTPLELNSSQTREVHTIGSEITQFLHATHEIYNHNSEVRSLLDKNKPQIFLGEQNPDYLFVRPDMIITPNGFSIAEIETSPFGLGLAELLNSTYRQEGFETLVSDTVLPEYVQSRTPVEGTIVYTPKTSSYSGQLAFLADTIFGRNWNVQEVNGGLAGNIYRGFYLYEYLQNEEIRKLLDNHPEEKMIFPSLTPFFEEKALLSLLWDTRCEQFLRNQLGAGYDHLRTVVPETWIVGQERYFAPGLPNGIQDSLDLATVSKSKRTFVLKSSGFAHNSSWKEGVYFLHEQSVQRSQDLLHQASSSETLHIIQSFHKGTNIPMQYEDEQEGIKTMMGRVRLTPYYAYGAENEGELIAIKATAREKTDYIHASSDSINTAVANGHNFF